ncbi:SH3 domain-containing protein [Marinoscillum sp.]|uniref:SH3 domain-containing protein n=1 Tax=Marinoscillum sp. TaxID=2024838 RepID=UPI003BAD67B3
MNHFFSRIIFSLIFTGLFTFGAHAQTAELSTADSLFSNQKYTEAFEIYENIFQQKMASSAMLTRMAFIQEGLGNYGEALYYLNLYYLRSSDKGALVKMREIAEEHGLSGYEYSDFKFFENFIRKYQHLITLCLIAFSIFLLGYSFRKTKKDERPMISVALQALTLILILVVNNEMFLKQSGIIQKDQSLLMSGPSAGAEPLRTIGLGNKVVILESDELWTKIEWDGEMAYIRNKNLRRL